MMGLMFLKPAVVTTYRILHDFIQGHIDYLHGIQHGVFAYRFMSGARP